MGGGNSATQQGLMTKLQQIIQSNCLEAFYPPQKLQMLMGRLNSIDFRYTLQLFMCLTNPLATQSPDDSPMHSRTD